MHPSPTPSSDSIPFPMGTVRVGIGVMTVLLIVSTVLTWRMGEQIRRVMESQIEVLTAAERVDHYGSVLELSIKAVVATGDAQAAERYRDVQPQLRQSLARLRNSIQLRENKVAAEAIDRADLQLVAMEYEALELAADVALYEAKRLGRNRCELSVPEVA